MAIGIFTHNHSGKKTKVSCQKALANLLSQGQIERFSIECRKTKAKVITLANHKEHTQYSEPIKTRSNYR